MQSYQRYFLDKVGHIIEVEAAEHIDDAGALSWAEGFPGRYPQCHLRELWCGERLVDRQRGAR
jgi:hypothetical protein